MIVAPVRPTTPFRSSIAVAYLLFLVLSLAAIATAQNPVPLINQPLIPDTKVPGAAGFTLTVNGTGFVSGATVNWNGTALATTFVSSARVTATVPATDVAKAATASVTVVNPGPGGGPSNVVFFPVSLPVNLAFGSSAYPAGTGPGSVATADFNKDGKLDLVLPDPGSGTVSTLMGNGDGTFLAPVSYSVGQGMSWQFFQVAVGDFNGDGNADFVVSDFQDSYVSVFLSNGDGTFKPGVTYTVGQNPTAVAVGDLNRDGKLDLAVSNQTCADSTTCTTGSVSILLGNGDGTFQPHVDVDAGLDPNWVMLGDFNRDGKMDLAVVDGQGNSFTSAVLILLGNGDGTFQVPVSYPLFVNAASGTTADFNADGNLDIAVADNIGVVSILLGKGDGTFSPRVDYTSGSFPFGGFAVGDFNQDNHVDLAVSDSGSNAVAVYFGNGDGTFQLPVLVNTGVTPEGVAAGDFNQDGRLDFAVANLSDSTASILLQNGAISLSPTSLNFGGQLVGSGAKKIVVLSNLGTATLTITGIAVAGTDPGEFVENNNCGSSLLAGGHCQIQVTFTPAQVGPRSAVLTVTDSDPSSPQSVPLSGVGATSGPNATLSSTSLTFATQPIGIPSPAQTVTLSNYGTQALSITDLSISAPFQQTHTCTKSLAPGASCTFSITFTPESRGKFNGTLSITDNAPGSPQAVSLAGVGTVVELNPSSLSFGEVVAGSSRTDSTTLTNVGKVALNISNMAITGTNASLFTQTNTCGNSVAGSTSCTITVTFHPTGAGFFTATLSITDNGGGSPQPLPLSGGGCVLNKKHQCVTIVSPPVRSAISNASVVSVPVGASSTAVGTRILALVDSERTDPFLANGIARELLVRLWYPAASDTTCKSAEYTSAKVWNYFSQLTKLPLPQVSTNSCLDAPVSGSAHPVVVFTPGYTGTFTDYTFLFEDLARRGYVIVSVDHTYEATAVEFPDGRLIESKLGSHLNNTWHDDEPSMTFALTARLDDLRFVLNQLPRLNGSREGPFSGKLDLTRIAIAGHSFGGRTAWQSLYQDARFKAGILLDPFLIDAPSMPTHTPVMLLTMGHEQRSNEECRLWGDLHGPRVAVNLRGSEHLTPSDIVWLAPGAIRTGNMTAEQTMAAIRDYVAAFLDANLSGETTNSLLSGTSSRYPDAELKTQQQTLCTEP